MSDDRTDDTIRIAAYLAGGGTPDERAVMQAWIAESAERTRELERLERVWRVAEGTALPVDVETIWNAVARRIGDEGSATRAVGRGDHAGLPEQAVVRQPGGEVAAAGRTRPMVGSALLSRSPMRRVGYAIGAFAVLAAVGVTGYITENRTVGSNVRSVTTYATGNGQRAKITLADGTVVSLNVASRLEIMTDFGGARREVRLNGEAYFDVSHHEGAPFTVVAGNATARVLGTSLVVRHYATDRTTLVAVRTGRVAVQSAVLHATQRVTVSPDGALVRGVADSSVYGFTTGTLSLEPMPITNAIVELDRWYDADIQLGDPALASLGMGGKFAAGSLTDLATYLEGTLPVRAVRDGRRLTLYPR